MNEIGNKIKELMTEKGVSYRNLAYQTDIPKSALQRYITGETAKIPINRLELIAGVLGTTAAYLMGWEEKDAEDKRQEEKVKYALFSGDTEVTDEMWEEVKEFARFVESKYTK